MIQDNPFADLIPGGAPQPMAPPAQQQAPGVIYGRPKQPDPLSVQRFAFDVAKDQRDQSRDARRDALTEQTTALQNQVTQLTIADKEREARLAEEADRKRAGLKDAEGAAARRVLTAIGRARDKIGFLSTGTPGQLLQGWGGTDARDLAAQLQTIKGNLGFDRLQMMRDMSPTGGALGQVAVQELEALQSTVASLDQAQSAEELARGLDEVESMYSDILRRFEVNNGAQRQQTEGGDIARQFRSLSGENIADFMSGLSGGQYDINEDGSVNYNGQPVEVSAAIANSDEFRAAYAQKFGRLPPVQVDVEAGVVDPGALAVDRGQGGFMETADAAVRGIADTATLGMADELAAAGRTIFGGGTMAQNLQAERNVDRYDEQNNFGARLAGQVTGGFALPIGTARTPAELARVGAAYGGGYGFGSTDGGIGDRLLGGAGGAAIGAGSAYGLARLGQAAAGRGGGGGGPGGDRAAGAELMAAAQRQGVDVLPADTGGPFVRRLTSAAVQAPMSGGPIIRRAQQSADQMMGARDRIASQVGNAVDPVEMGEAVGAAARGFAGRTSARGGNLYDEAQRLAGDVRVDPQRAREVLGEQIARLEQVPGGGAGLNEARAMLQNLEGNFTVQGIRDMRTEMFVAPELRGTPASSRLREIVNAAADDVARSLEAQGRGEAADAFRRADRYWRQRIETIDQTIAPIIGSARNPKSGEQVVQALMNATRSNSARLTRFVQSLPAEEQATLRATVIGQLGRANAGTQNAEGTAFSVNQFLTHWNQMTPRAKDTLFRGEARDALNDLARIAQGTREAQGFANRSNTGGAMFGNVGGWIGVGSVAPTTAALGAVGQMVTGRLLASPRFARWLARPARSEEDLMRQARRLSQIAAREPAIANDILPLQQALQQSIRSAAADEPATRQPQNGR